jgi:transcriptional regulator with XRE-family HTH domain
MNLDPNCGPNVVGRKVAKLRYQRAWTQDMLVARLQVRGCDITRDILANIETRRSVATDKHVFFLAEVFGVEIAELFRP